MQDREPPVVRARGRDWRIAIDADVAWIREGTTIGRDITSAIPPVFAAYATVLVPDPNDDLPVVRRVRAHVGEQRWWLGFLETGTSDMVFPDAPRVRLYSDWRYVVALAGPDEAMSWRFRGPSQFHGRGPDLIFPTDRSWLMSWLWDDDWYCIGGPTDLIDALVDSDDLDARRVSLGEDATPPGFTAI